MSHSLPKTGDYIELQILLHAEHLTTMSISCRTETAKWSTPLTLHVHYNCGRIIMCLLSRAHWVPNPCLKKEQLQLLTDDYDNPCALTSFHQPVESGAAAWKDIQIYEIQQVITTAHCESLLLKVL